MKAPHDYIYGNEKKVCLEYDIPIGSHHNVLYS